MDRNGAPSGEKHLLLVDPPVIDGSTGARGSALTLAERWALPFLRAGRQTVVFGKSRVAVEIMLSNLRERLRQDLGPRSRVRGYRGGYLPTERRAIERGLRDGEVLGVVSTNALELGVDIGRLDVAVLAGYPGSIAGTWQQMGRAGRRGDVSVAVLVASPAPVDQYVIHHPEFVLGGQPEEARLDPDNLHVLLAHIRAATFELPFEPGEWFGPGPADELLAFLGEGGQVRQADDGRWYWSSENFPASEVSLRAAAPENVVIIDTSPDRPRVLGEVDLFSAQVLVHEHAIYMHESTQYHVDRLEWGERKAYVHRIDADHYTYANRAVTLKPLDVFATAPATGGTRVHGEVMVASLVTLYKKLKFGTDENVGWGPIDLPEIELQTTAYWLTAEGAAAGWRRDELDVALIGAGRAIQAVSAVLLMVDPRDLGLVSQVRSPHHEAPTIYLYEAMPGGVGLSERLFARHDELVAGAADLVRDCPCDAGCPACTGPRLEPEVDGKALALRLLAALGAGARNRRPSRDRGAALGHAGSAGSRTCGRAWLVRVGCRGTGPAARQGTVRADAGAEPSPRDWRRPWARMPRTRRAAGWCGASSRPSRSRWTGSAWPGFRVTRRRTHRSCAWTRRRPGWPRPPARWRSSSGSPAGTARSSARPSSSSPTTPTSRRSSPSSRRGSPRTHGS